MVWYTLRGRSGVLWLGIAFYLAWFSAVHYGVKVRSSAPELILSDGVRFSVGEFTLGKIETIDPGWEFSRLLPEFDTIALEEEWWRLHEEVLELLQGNTDVMVQYWDRHGTEHKKSGRIGYSSPREVFSVLWVSYLPSFLLVTGAWLSLSRQRSETGRVLGAFFLAFAFWLTFLVPVATRSITLETDHFRRLTILIYWSSAGAWCLYHLCFIFPRRKRILSCLPWLPYLGYALAVVECVCYAAGWMAFGSTFIQVVIGAVTVCGMLLHSVIVEKDRFIRHQMGFLVVGPIVIVVLIAIIGFAYAGMVAHPLMSVTALAMMFMVLPLSVLGAVENIKLYRKRIEVERRCSLEIESRLEAEKRCLMDRQRIRDELRADLHDTVLARLAVVSRYLDLAKKRLTFDDAAADVGRALDEQIESLAVLGKRGIDLVDISKEKAATATSLFEIIERSTQGLFSGSEIETNLKFENRLSDGTKLEGRLCRTVFLVFREIATNCMRHSHASRLDAELIVGDEQVCGCLRDNGMGFPRDLLEDEGLMGQGTASMNWRVRESGGTIQRSNRSEGGAEVRFSLDTLVEEKGREVRLPGVSDSRN